MNPVSTLALNIRQAKTPFYARLKRLAKSVIRWEIPAPKAIFRPLYEFHVAARQAFLSALTRFYYQPLFRARCDSCGPGLLLHLKLPYIYGNLGLRVGTECKINGYTTFAAGSVHQRPELILGDRTNVGYGVVISCSERVELGSHVRVADGCFITDNPGHPLDPIARRSQAVSADSIKPVCIEDDVWLGTRVTVMPGVTIGRATVVGAGSVVTKSLPPNVLAAGVPARVIRKLNQCEDRQT